MKIKTTFLLIILAASCIAAMRSRRISHRRPQPITIIDLVAQMSWEFPTLKIKLVEEYEPGTSVDADIVYVGSDPEFSKQFLVSAAEADFELPLLRGIELWEAMVTFNQTIQTRHAENRKHWWDTETGLGRGKFEIRNNERFCDAAGGVDERRMKVFR